MRVLVVDSNIDDYWGSPELVHYASHAGAATVYTRRAPHQDLPKDPSYFDAIILSGSKTSAMATEPWIERFHEFLKRSMSLRKPILGICYGHQALVRIMGGAGTMRKSEAPEVGWVEIEQVASSKILQGLPQKFYSFGSHFQEAAALPSNLRLIARSDRCGIQGFESVSDPIWGLQFHPEQMLEHAQCTIDEYKKKKSPALLHPDKSNKYYDAKVADQIFKNFFEQVKK